MKLIKYPFAVFSAALFTVMLITPISSIANLLWLSSVDMPVGFGSSLEVLLFDFQRLGIALYGVVILGFIVAFTVSGLIAKYTRLGGKSAHGAIEVHKHLWMASTIDDIRDGMIEPPMPNSKFFSFVEEDLNNEKTSKKLSKEEESMFSDF